MTSKIRITGLVRFADQLRRELTAPTNPPAWKRKTRQALKTVDDILRQHGLSSTDLPAPSRRAYHFLKQADFDRAAPARPAQPKAGPTLRFPGLMRDLDQAARQLGGRELSDTDSVARHIEHCHDALERAIDQRGATPGQLSDKTRAARGWLAYFAKPDALQQYRDAVATCHHSFERTAEPGRVDLSIEFRPIAGLYRLQQQRGQARLRLPTAMITFDPVCFDELCRHALGLSRQKRRVLQATTEEPFQLLRTQLEVLGGIPDSARGRVHDLAQSLERVNRKFFGGRVEAPRLCWSTRLTRRKLGHYDPINDTIMLSATLDSVQVPVPAVDFVMYHELLHKVHGTDWRGDRAHVHTAAFKRDERRFPDFAAIERLLTELSRDPMGQ